MTTLKNFNAKKKEKLHMVRNKFISIFVIQQRVPVLSKSIRVTNKTLYKSFLCFSFLHFYIFHITSLTYNLYKHTYSLYESYVYVWMLGRGFFLHNDYCICNFCSWIYELRSFYSLLVVYYRILSACILVNIRIPANS